MNLQPEKKQLKNEIDKLELEDLQQSVKAMLNCGRNTQKMWGDEAFVKELDRRIEPFNPAAQNLICGSS
jgi:hypothetical protein